MKQDKNPNWKYISLLAGILSIVVVFTAIDTLADTQCSSQDCVANTSITIGNSAPTITWVESGETVTATGESTGTAYVAFNVTDTNGASDINDSTANCTGYKSGETDRAASSCAVDYNSGNLKQYNCTVTFQYYDAAAADWAWNCTVSDNSSASDYNDSVTFTVNTLDYIDQNTFTWTWAAAQSNTNDQEAGAAINLDNGGNQDYESCNVTAYNASSGSNIIPASAFALNNATSSPAGTAMVENTSTSISSWFTLTHGDGATEDIFAYLDAPAIPTGTYTSDSNWLVDITS